jgi:tetratricopeptide (TPR) repeat protein
MTSRFRVFLSAVSSEFESARDALANDLQSHEILVCVQRSFRHDHNAGTLLHKLSNYIEQCNVVIFLMGARSAAGFPQPPEEAPFADGLPNGIAEASYTQWEYVLARKFHKPCLIYVAGPEFPADKAAGAGDKAALQAAFVEYVKSDGKQWSTVTNKHDFRACVLRDLLRAPLPPEVLKQVRKLQPIIVLPYHSLGPLFKGRDAFLCRLRDSLVRDGGGTAAIAGKAVHGLGGVGKTRAAVEYAHTNAAGYTAVALLDAETPDRLRSALAQLIGPLRLTIAAPEEDVRVEAAIGWLNDNPAWLLILDNIDTDAALQAAQRLLGRLRGGHVVLTSRLASFPRGIETLDLDVLTPDDAADFLDAATQGRRRAPDDAEQARLLGEELGQLALALEMAAATIEARKFGFAEYRRMWQGNRARVVGWARPQIIGYHHAVAETWRTSVDLVPPAALALLERLSFLAPDPIPATLLDAAVEGVPTGEDARAALDDLAKYSLATLDADSGAFVVHRLVQDVTRRGLERTDRYRQRLEEALGQVYIAFAAGRPDDVRIWPIVDPLAPHAEAVAALADAAGIAEPTVGLLGRLAWVFRAKARHTRAEPFYNRALAVAEANFPATDSRVAIRLSNLAQLLQATNRLGEAEPLMRRALAIDAASHGQDHPNVAIRFNNLAGLLQATNRPGDAEPLMRRALAINEANYGPDHPRVATALNNLAHLLQDTNRPGEAEPLMRRALAIDAASYGQDHPNVAIDLNNLAGLLQATNRLGEAEPLMRRALAIDEASYGPDHPDVARDLNNLAHLLQATNRLGEAEPLMRRGVAIFLAFQRDTGHANPHRDAVIGHYRGLLDAMGKTRDEIVATIGGMLAEAGVSLG